MARRLVDDDRIRLRGEEVRIDVLFVLHNLMQNNEARRRGPRTAQAQATHKHVKPYKPQHPSQNTQSQRGSLAPSLPPLGRWGAATPPPRRPRRIKRS